ncbi:hypothetical protein BDY24DRAFT_436415 [Mrakia frigida]|uniref:tethering complex subunit PEP5 n=1 Tax=Mrakia frigida TaxID=29902 RepID=UPI003FCC0395
MAPPPPPPPAPLPPSTQPWRTFSFFNSTDVKDSQDLASSPEVFKSPPTISALEPSSIEGGSLLLADLDGRINVLDRSFEGIRSWIAFEDGRCTHLMEARGIAVTLGEETSTPYPILKIWDLLHLDKKTKTPILLRSIKVQHGGRPHPITTCTLTPSLSHLAIGLGDGTLLLYRHLSQSLSPASPLTSLPKPKILLEGSGAEPITGLVFRERTQDIHLWVVTTGRVMVGHVAGKRSGGELRVLDEFGAGLGCVKGLVDESGEGGMVLARDEAVYLYGTEARGMSYAYEGPKSSIHSFKNNVIIVSPPFVPTVTSTSQTVRNLARAQPATASPTDVARLAVMDLDTQVLNYSGTFKDGVRDIFCLWGSIFVLGNDGKISRLDEVPLSAKLAHLFSKSYFPLALSVAKSQSIGKDGLADIHRRYGDHLYGKGDYEGAVSQYVKTLGELQPSYVIRKFLDAQRINNLTTYLQELHSAGLANSDHTTLLLNCYTKTSDVARLDSFIRTTETRGPKGELPFDLETAIKVCRQAGYYEHAVFLAKKFGRHEEYLSIQIEDAGDWADALRYLSGLGHSAAEENMVRYGKTLLSHQPAETTDLLIDLCSGTLSPQPSSSSYLNGSSSSSPSTPAPNSNPTSSPPVPTSNSPAYLNVFNSGLNYGRTAVEAAAAATVAIGGAFPPLPGPSTARPTKPTLEGVEPRSSKESFVVVEEEGRDQGPSTTGPSYIPPSPRQYFAHFVNHPNQLLRFLEAVALARWNQKVDLASSSSTRRVAPPPAYDSQPRTNDEDENDDGNKVDQRVVWNTLLELYLLFSTTRAGSSSKETYKLKALRLLEQGDKIPYDPTHALILCSTNGFTEGLVELWEKLGMYEDVVRFWMEKEREDEDEDGDEEGKGSTTPTPRHASEEVLSRLRLYGPTQPQLYPLVLRFLTSSNALLARHGEDLKEVLETIDEERIMPTLEVVQVLSRNGVASVGVVKDWLREKVRGMRVEVDSDKTLITSYRTEAQSKQREIEALTDTSKPQVFQVTRCTRCNGTLDLPSVHFMCKHSFHQLCLPDTNNPDCPNCAHQHGLIREVRANHARERKNELILLLRRKLLSSKRSID